MAVRLAQAGEAVRAERQRIKERVLQIDQLAAEEEVRRLLSVCSARLCSLCWCDGDTGSGGADAGTQPSTR